MYHTQNAGPLLEWLRKNIGSLGQTYTAAELVQRITGKPLDADALMRHLEAKAEMFYLS